MIDPLATVGPVSLTVSDLNRMVNFYKDVVGLTSLTRSAKSATLGTATGFELVELVEDAAATRPNRRSPGLFHHAILLPTRSALGRSLIHLTEADWSLTGAGDHLVSEALYLDDPEGNGIELYADRPRDTWSYQDGMVRMATLAVDIDSLVEEGRTDDTPWTGIADGTVIGHIHLKVSDLEAARAFYENVIGFDLMAAMPQAAFLSAGGYHHHIGLNTWMSNGSAPSQSGVTGLRGFSINLPDQAALDEVVGRVGSSGATMETTEHGLFVRDPSRNGIWLRKQRPEN